MPKLHCAIGLYSQRMRHQRQLYGIYSVFIFIFLIPCSCKLMSNQVNLSYLNYIEGRKPSSAFRLFYLTSHSHKSLILCGYNPLCDPGDGKSIIDDSRCTVKYHCLTSTWDYSHWCMLHTESEKMLENYH